MSNEIIKVKLIKKKKQKKFLKKYLSIILSILSLQISLASFYINNSSKVTFLADGIDINYEKKEIRQNFEEDEFKETEKTVFHSGTKVSVINEGRKSSLVKITNVDFMYDDRKIENQEITDAPSDRDIDYELDVKNSFGDIIFNYGSPQHIKSPFVAKSESITDLFFIAWEGFDVYFNTDDDGIQLNNKIAKIKFHGTYTTMFGDRNIESKWIPVSGVY